MSTPVGLFGLGGLDAADDDSGRALVDELIGGLEGFELPEPLPKVGRGRRVLGRIGDALLNAARVKAGGAPGIGPFSASLQAREEDFQNRTAQAEAANRDLRDRIRVGDFQRGRQLAGAKELKREDRRTRVTIEKEKGIVAGAKRVEDAANAFRHSLRQKIIDLGIETDVNLLEADETQLKEILDGHDPTAAFQAFMESLPDDMEVGTVSKNANGTFSFSAKSKTAASKEIPAGVIAALIKGGVDPAPFIKDPNLAKAARTAAEANNKNILEDEADQFLSDMRSFADANEVGADGSIDSVNLATAAMADDIIKMRGSNTPPDKVRQYYEREADIAADMLKAGEWTEGQALDYLTRLRQALSVGFPGLPLTNTPLFDLEENPNLDPAPTTETVVPTEPGIPSPTLVGLGRAVEGVKTGLGKAVSGLKRTLTRPADGGGGGGAN